MWHFIAQNEIHYVIIMKFEDVPIAGISDSTKLAYKRDIIRLQKLMSYKAPSDEFDVASFTTIGESQRVIDNLAKCKYSSGTKKNIIRSLCKYLEAAGSDTSEYRTVLASIDAVPPITNILRNISMILTFPVYPPAIRFAAHILLSRDPRLLALTLSDLVAVTLDKTSNNYIDTEKHFWFVSGKCYQLPPGLYEKIAELLKQPFIADGDDPVATLKVLDQIFSKAVDYSYTAAAHILAPCQPTLSAV